MYKIVDNFLPEKDFKEVKDGLLGPLFGWHFNDSVTFPDIKRKEHWYFTHMFMRDGIILSRYYEHINEIFFKSGKIENDSIIRIKANLYPRDNKIIEHEWHSDYPYKHCGALFYINTNNGVTELHDGTKINSVENRMLFFDPSQKHRSTNCTDELYRMNINFNFLRENDE